jgi:hypothetical protein
MSRLIRFAAAAVALTLLILGFSEPSYAGTFLYQTCALNTSIANNANAFTASLENNGLFLEWTGTTAKLMPVNGKNVCVPAVQMPDLFKNSVIGGVNKITEPFAGNKMLAPGDRMLFSSIRDTNKNGINKSASTLLTGGVGGTPVRTAFGNATPMPKGDPVVDVTNDGSSSMTLDFVLAFINNSEDPLDLNTTFAPDGRLVAVMPLSPDCSNGDVIMSGVTCEFSFVLPPNVTNWAFVAVTDNSDGTFTDLVATDVPEPASAILLALALIPLLISWRKIARQG